VPHSPPRLKLLDVDALVPLGCGFRFERERVRVCVCEREGELFFRGRGTPLGGWGYDDLGLRVGGLRCKVYGLEFGVSDLGIRIWGTGFRV